MKLNPTKSVEMIVSLRPRASATYPAITLDNNTIQRVQSTKLLDIVISEDLSWTNNTQEMLKKATRTLFVLRRLKLAGASPTDLRRVYETLIRPHLELNSSVWGSALSNADVDALEAFQKTCFKICFGRQWESASAELPSLAERRRSASQKLFREALNDQSHLLHDLVPEPLEHDLNTRASSRGALLIPMHRTRKMGTSFVVAAAKEYNGNLK